MKRSSFIKSLITLCAAPSVIASIKHEETITVIEKFPLFPYLESKKISAWWKVTDEMLKDESYMDWLFSLESQFFERFKEAGADLSKPYTMQVGLSGDDFTRNLKTCIITQYV